MDKVRIGIIGMGNMGRFHANDLLEGRVDRGELTAVGSTSPHKLEEYLEKGISDKAAALSLDQACLQLQPSASLSSICATADERL